jgi:nitrate reductase assembly molybdenum cofactor insertion protein NarJ
MTASSELHARELVAQAAAWPLAALLLERPRPGWRQELQKLSSEVSDPELAACASHADQGSEEKYHRLFGPGAAVSPREVSYSGFEDPGRLMAELNAFYHAFAFEPRHEEPADHLSVEAGFIAYLFLKQAYAQVRGDVEAAAVALRARDQFMEGHLGRCAQGMRERLGGAPLYLRQAVLWMAQRADPKFLEAP